MKARTLIAISFLIVALVVEMLIPTKYSSAKHALTAATTPPCGISYQVNQWSGGFTAQIQITNNSVSLTHWILTWTFSGNQQITSAWNAVVAQTGSVATAQNLAYNGSLPSGGSTQFGVQATSTGSNTIPTNFALNGLSCEGGSSSTPTPSLTPSPITATPTATPAPGSGCSKAIFCDGFENQTGSTPSGVWQASYLNCQGTGTVSVDRTVAHSGSTSIRVDGHNGYCNHVFFGTQSAIAAAGPDLYVRFFIRHTTPLPIGHVAFAAMRDTNDGGNDLRLGGQNSALQWNRQSDDATLPAQSPVGVALSRPLPTNQWSCVEFEVNQPQGTMRTWLNGTEVLGLHLDKVPTPDVDAQWIQSRPNWHPALADLRLGWESYSGGDDTLWFDDVAIGSHQVGCAL